jgi:hypothetical protein
VLGGTGLKLRAIQRYMAQAHHPTIQLETQDHHKEILEGIKVEAPKLTDTAVVRLLVGDERPEGQILVACALDLAR